MYPQTSYLVCGTPRSGTSLLCEALKATGIAGYPEEYFWSGNEVFLQERWGVSTNEDYLRRALEEGTTPNGVFGAKVMWGYFDDLIARLRQLLGPTDLPPPPLIATAFPNLHYIFIRRRDHVRQAVSWELAYQTDIWTKTETAQQAPRSQPIFDMAAIETLVELIGNHEQEWQNYFREAGVSPLEIVYEDLVQAYEETAHRIIDYLDIPVTGTLELAPRRLKKQAGALSEEWVQSYTKRKEASFTEQ